MDEETKLDKTTVTNVLEKLLNTIKDDLKKIRNADDTGDFFVEYSGIDNGKRYSGRSYCDTEKDAEKEMTRLMEDEKNDTISIHIGNRTVKFFARGYN